MHRKASILLFVGILTGSLLLPGVSDQSIPNPTFEATDLGLDGHSASIFYRLTKRTRRAKNGSSRYVASIQRAPVRTVTKKAAAAQVAPNPRPQTFLPVVDQPDIQYAQKVIADEILRLLPAKCIDALQNFYVKYDMGDQRGFAGKSSAIISGTVPDNEFRALIVHEVFGHVTELGCLQGTPSAGESEFRDGADLMYQDDPSVQFYRISWADEHTQKPGAKEKDFVTGYAAHDAFEDLAETVTYYFFHEDDFRVRAQTNSAMRQKLQWIETYLFQSNPTKAVSKYTWNGTVPWDATKLQYSWR